MDRPVEACNSLFELLSSVASQRGAALALTAPGRKGLSYAALLHHVETTAAQLNAMGVARGDRVVIVLPNGPAMAAAFVAVASVATAAPLNPAYRAPEFDFYLADLNAKALIVAAGSDSPVVAVAESRGVPVLRVELDATGPAGLFCFEGAAKPTTQAEFAHGDDVALVLHTSGTTSRPKIVPLSQRNLCVSAANIRASLQLSSDDLCLNVMPLFHIHGLVAATLSSLSAGAAIACTGGFVATEFFEWVGEIRPTWYTAVPTMHQAILTRAEVHGDVIATSRLRFIRSSSSALPPQVALQTERVFGVPMIEAYGMTEASHQMCSNPLPPGERKPGSVGPSAGPQVAVMNGSGALLPAGQTGEVVIRGDNVTAGYESNANANAEAFAHGWFHTGDQGYLDAAGYLFLTGRIKEIINRGGEKISPREVDEALLDHPAVAQAVTFAMPDDRMGEEIAAAVVLREQARSNGDGAAGDQAERTAAVDEHTLMQFAAQRLADFKVPRRIVIVESIPKGPTGKLQRIGLAEKLGLSVRADGAKQGKTRHAHVEPRNQIERELAALWSEVLRIDGIGVDDNFFELGGDSVLASQVLARVRERMGIQPEMLVFFESPTLAGMAQALEAGAGAADSRGAAAMQPGSADLAALVSRLEAMSDEDAARLLNGTS